MMVFRTASRRARLGCDQLLVIFSNPFLWEEGRGKRPQHRLACKVRQAPKLRTCPKKLENPRSTAMGGTVWLNAIYPHRSFSAIFRWISESSETQEACSKDSQWFDSGSKLAAASKQQVAGTSRSKEPFGLSLNSIGRKL